MFCLCGGVWLKHEACCAYMVYVVLHEPSWPVIHQPALPLIRRLLRGGLLESTQGCLNLTLKEDMALMNGLIRLGLWWALRHLSCV